MEDERTFGQRLRGTRVRAGLSQSDLEEISGIPKARLSRYENGHVAPSIQTLERLAKALSVSEASLLGDRRFVLEAFFDALSERGVRIDSDKQARRLADAVAEMYYAMVTGGVEGGEDELVHAEDDRPSGAEMASSMVPAGSWPLHSTTP